MHTTDRILDKAAEGERLTEEEGLHLLTDAPLLELAAVAHARRLQRHPDGVVTFVVDRNINYTNVCVSGCKFCAFYKDRAETGGYIIETADLLQKIEETVALGGTQILLQGGMHPDLDLAFHEALLKTIRRAYPEIHIHGFSPPEIAYFSDQAEIPVQECIEKLMAAGLGSIPGGGAEILVNRVREEISPNKCNADRWLSVMETAHDLGLRTTATMMFGHVETPKDIILHLQLLREVQDRTGGFTAFIPWTFQPDHTRIAVSPATSVEYLRVLALSRLYLDNIDNIQASWVTQADKIAQTALFFGANDMGSTMIEENVVAAAGVSYRLPKEEILRLIRDAGFTPIQRDCFYTPVRSFS